MTKNTIFSFLQACEATVIKTAQKSWKGATPIVAPFHDFWAVLITVASQACKKEKIVFFVILI